MRLRLHSLSLSFLILAALATAAPTNQAVHRLQKHGVGVDAASLTQFLVSGLPTSVDYDALPKEPAGKCQLLIDAMAVAGSKRMQESYAALEALAQGTLSEGILAMLERDLLLAVPAERPERHEQIVLFLRYNAAVALGLLGNAQALPVMRQLYEAEKDPTIKAQYALGMTCLGDGAGIDFLIDEIGKANQGSSVACVKSIYYISGIDYGYLKTSPVALRKKLAADYAKWWEGAKATFALNPEAVIRRRLQTPIVAVPSGNSVRSLVARATNYTDFSDEMGSRSAEEKLESMGDSIRKDLEKIAQDEMEDLLVRSYAINRYALLGKKSARKVLKKLQNDENPEIVAIAKAELEKIESGAIEEQPLKTHVLVDEPAAKEKKGGS